MDLSFEGNDLKIDDNSSYKVFKQLVYNDWNEIRDLKSKHVFRFLNKNYMFYKEKHDFTGATLSFKRMSGIYTYNDFLHENPISIVKLSNLLTTIFGFEYEFIENSIKFWLAYKYLLTDKQIESIYNFFCLSDWVFSLTHTHSFSRLTRRNNNELVYINTDNAI